MIVSEAFMHGNRGPTFVLNLEFMSEEEKEQQRLKDAARNSQRRVTSDFDPDEEEAVSMPVIIEMYGDEMDTRVPDQVLMDHMGEMKESEMFNRKRMPDFARAMGADDAMIEQFKMQMEMDEPMEMMAPEAMMRFKQDLADYKKFGGDPMAMAMSRDMKNAPMSSDNMDELLIMAMDSSSMMDMSDPMNRAMAALEEEFGRDAQAMFEGEADGFLIFSVDCPRRGMVQYFYDSDSGTGRVMRM